MNIKDEQLQNLQLFIFYRQNHDFILYFESIVLRKLLKFKQIKYPTVNLSMGCKKDIFAVFAYEFELSHLLVKSFAYAHGEIIYFVNCEI